MSNWTMLSSGTRRDPTETYGEHVVVSEVGQFRLIHLDNPSPEEVTRRVGEFNPDQLFEDDCPICQMLRNEPCDVVYDGEALEEES